MYLLQNVVKTVVNVLEVLYYHRNLYGLVLPVLKIYIKNELTKLSRKK